MRAISMVLDRLKGQKLGVLCHPASVDKDYVHILDRAAELKLDIKAIFGPEHGFTGHAQYMVSVGDEERHPRFGCPIYSLYGATYDSLSPKKEWLRGFDAIVIDLQDIGTRYYTFVWTAVLTMRVAAQAGVKVILLDRPNPIGRAKEGGGVDKGFFSFVGLYDVPVRHGLTMGEMLQLVRKEEKLDVQLEVMMKDSAWVFPSPNMPTVDTALVYPGICFLEACNVSEGRGTTRPFEIVGAAYIDSDDLAAKLTALNEPGVRFRPLSFMPTFNKFAGKLCGGVQIHVTDAAAFKPFRLGLRLMRILSAYPEFKWREEPYEFVDDVNAFDLLAGTSAYREAFASDAALLEVYAEREKRVSAFEARVRA